MEEQIDSKKGKNSTNSNWLLPQVQKMQFQKINDVELWLDYVGLEQTSQSSCYIKNQPWCCYNCWEDAQTYHLRFVCEWWWRTHKTICDPSFENPAENLGPFGREIRLWWLNSWMDAKLFVGWIREVFIPGVNNQRKTLGFPPSEPGLLWSDEHSFPEEWRSGRTIARYQCDSWNLSFTYHNRDPSTRSRNH